MKFISRAFGLCLILFSSPAHAWDLSLVGAADIATPSITASPAISATGGTAFGGGVLARIPLFGAFAFGLGAVYLPRSYGFSQAGVTVSLGETRIEVPVTLDFNIGSLIHGFVGGYYSLGIGNVNVSSTSAAGTLTQSQSFASSNLTASDYGLLAGAGIRFPPDSEFGLFGVAQFLYGLANASTASGVTWNYRDIQVLAGVDIRFGGSPSAAAPRH